MKKTFNLSGDCLELLKRVSRESFQNNQSYCIECLLAEKAGKEKPVMRQRHKLVMTPEVRAKALEGLRSHWAAYRKDMQERIDRILADKEKQKEQENT